MLNRGEIESALAGNTELRGLEVKGPRPSTERRFLAKVAKAALSMGNLRDGGHVLIGIDDNRLSEMQPGLGDDALASWLAIDDVGRRLAVYADPPLRVRVSEVQMETGARIVQLEVAEFEVVPHLCAEDFDDVVRRGALYVRSASVPETVEIARLSEMRELLDLATSKALRSYVGLADRAGVRLDGVRDPFLAEQEGLWNE